MYLDSDEDYDSHLDMKLNKIYNKFLGGDLVRDGENYSCKACDISLSQYRAEDHFKTSRHKKRQNYRGRVCRKRRGENLEEASRLLKTENRLWLENNPCKLYKEKNYSRAQF